MATPALAKFGSDELKKQFLVPTIAGDVVACIGVSEVGSGSDVASIKTTAVPKKGTYVCICYQNYWGRCTLYHSWLLLSKFMKLAISLFQLVKL